MYKQIAAPFEKFYWRFFHFWISIHFVSTKIFFIATGSSKGKEDPIMKKAVLDKCEGKIAQLYRLRISGQGMFFPMTQPKIVKYDGVSTLTFNHPRIEFNMVPEEPFWTCPDVVIETKKEEPTYEKKDESEEIVEALVEQNSQKDKQKDSNASNRNASNPLVKISVVDTRTLQQPVTTPSEPLQQLLSQPPPVIANVSYPSLSQYRNIAAPFENVVGPFSRPPPSIVNSGQLPVDFLAEMEKERRRREIEMEWDRLMENKERKDVKRKKKKRRSQSRSSSSGRSRRSKSRKSPSRHRSRSRGRSHRRSYSRGRSHRRSHSRHRSRDRSKGRRHRRRSRSLSLSPSPPRKRSRSPLRIRMMYKRSPSPRIRRRSSSFLRSLEAELKRSPPRYQRSPPPRHLANIPGLMNHRIDAPPGPLGSHAPPGPHAPSGPHAPPGPQGPHAQPGPPGYDHYYNYGPGPYSNNPPPPGMDNYPPPYGPGMRPYGPMGPRGPGPGPGPWMDPHYGPPRGPGPWMGPPHRPPWYREPPMRTRGPMPAEKQKPLVEPKRTSNNLIDLTLKGASTTSAQKKPVVVVDITDDREQLTEDKKNEPTNKLVAEELKPAHDKSKSDVDRPKLVEDILVNKAKVISNIVPPGVSPDRETFSKYPNVESEFTRPMRAKFRKMLEPLDKVLDKIRLYQRDSFDYKTLIKSLESGKIEFVGNHTLHDGLLCKLEINRKQPDKFFKVVIPQTHVGRLLREIHSIYHDYSIGRIQRLVEDLFSNPNDFPLTKIISVMKQCKECIKQEENEREALRQKEILILDSPEPDKMDTDEAKVEENKASDPMVRIRKDRNRRRSSEREDRERKRHKDGNSTRHSETEKEGKSRRNSEKERSSKPKSERGGSKNKPQGKPAQNEVTDTYSKFEDLTVSRKSDDTKISPDKGNSKSTDGVGKKEVVKKGPDDEEKSDDVPKNGKKVPASTDEIVSNTASVPVSKDGINDRKKEVSSANDKKKPISLDVQKTTATKDSGGSSQATTNKAEQEKHKPQQKPTVNPDDFKERVRDVQMGVEDLCKAIADLEKLGKKAADTALLLKAGMLCRRIPPSKGQGKPEVKIVVTLPCLEKMVQIVHTMAVLHAPFQKTVTVFKKHFVPIDGLEKVVSDVLNSCAKCASDSKK